MHKKTGNFPKFYQFVLASSPQENVPQVYDFGRFLGDFGKLWGYLGTFWNDLGMQNHSVSK